MEVSINSRWKGNTLFQRLIQINSESIVGIQNDVGDVGWNNWHGYESLCEYERVWWILVVLN